MKLQNFLFVISTAIVATAVAQLPTNPVFQGFPPYFQQSGPVTLLQEQNVQLQQKMWDDQDLASIQNHRIKSVGVDHLSAGQIVKVRYMAPNNGRVVISLRDSYGNFVFAACSLINHGLWIKRFILNSFVNGRWDKHYQDVKGFPFTSPRVPTMITVQIKVTPTEFVISVNEVTLAHYPFRGSLTPDKVVKVVCELLDDKASIKGKVDKISVSF